jgi:hypothetical protein
MQPAASLFQLLLLVTIPRVLIPQAYLYAFQRNRSLFSITILEFAVHLMAALLGLWLFGWIGVGFGMILGNIIEKAALILFAKNNLKIPLSAYPWGIWGVYSLILVALWVLSFQKFNFLDWSRFLPL